MVAGLMVDMRTFPGWLPFKHVTRRLTLTESPTMTRSSTRVAGATARSSSARRVLLDFGAKGRKPFLFKEEPKNFYESGLAIS